VGLGGGGRHGATQKQKKKGKRRKKKNPNFFPPKSTQNLLEAELGFNEMKTQMGFLQLVHWWALGLMGLVTLTRITRF
jgi:hypothetical protein